MQIKKKTKFIFIVIYGTAKGKSQYIVYKRKAVKNIELAFKKTTRLLKNKKKYTALNQHESHENSHKYKFWFRCCLCLQFHQSFYVMGERKIS